MMDVFQSHNAVSGPGEGDICRSVTEPTAEGLSRLSLDHGHQAMNARARPSRGCFPLSVGSTLAPKRSASSELSRPEARVEVGQTDRKSGDEGVLSTRPQLRRTRRSEYRSLVRQPHSSPISQDQLAAEVTGIHASGAGRPESTKATKRRYPGLILQPDSSPISQDQLAAEVKGIYAGLVMVEAKCINVDAAQAANSKSHLGPEQWQALIALHRTLLYEHHDYLMATQHPSASQALRDLTMSTLRELIAQDDHKMQHSRESANACFGNPNTSHHRTRTCAHPFERRAENILFRESRTRQVYRTHDTGSIFGSGPIIHSTAIEHGVRNDHSCLKCMGHDHNTPSTCAGTVQADSGQCLSLHNHHNTPDIPPVSGSPSWSDPADFLDTLDTPKPGGIEDGTTIPLCRELSSHDTREDGTAAFRGLLEERFVQSYRPQKLRKEATTHSLPNWTGFGFGESGRKVRGIGERLLAACRTCAIPMLFGLSNAASTTTPTLNGPPGDQDSTHAVEVSVGEAEWTALQLITGLMVVAAVGNIVRMVRTRPEVRPAWSPHLAVGLSVITLIVDWTAPDDKPLRDAIGSGCFLALSHYIVKECLIVPSSRVLLWAPLLVGVALSVACSLSATAFHESDSTFSEVVVAGLPAAAVITTLAAYFLPDLMAQIRMLRARNGTVPAKENNDTSALTTGRLGSLQVLRHVSDRGDALPANGDLENQSPIRGHRSTWSAFTQVFTGLTAAGHARQHNGNHNDQRVFNLYYGQYHGQTTSVPSPAGRSFWAKLVS